MSQQKNYVARVQASVDLHVAQVRDLLMQTFVLGAPNQKGMLQSLAMMTKDREAAIRDIASGAFSDYVCPIASVPESGDHLLDFHQTFVRRASSILSLIQAQAIGTGLKVRLAESLAKAGSGTYLRARSVNVISSFSPKVRDNAGRVWSPGRLVALELRHAVVLARVECKLIEISLRELRDVATVTHPENYDLDGLTFSITGQTPNIPTYDDIKSKVFHPNSRAGVR